MKTGAKKCGFSMLEALLASGLLIVVLAIMLGAWFSARLDLFAHRKLTASRIAARKMEEFRQMPFAELPGPGTSTFSDSNLSDLPNGVGEYFVENYLSTSSLRHIAVAVSWSESSGTSTYRIDSIFTDGGTNSP